MKFTVIEKGNFEQDYALRFIIRPLRSATVQEAKALIQKYGDTKALRSPDALRLGACLAYAHAVIAHDSLDAVQVTGK